MEDDDFITCEFVSEAILKALTWAIALLSLVAAVSPVFWG